MNDTAVEQLFIVPLRKVTAVRALRDARFIPARFLCRLVMGMFLVLDCYLSHS